MKLLRELGLGTAEREVLDRGYQDAVFRLFRELLVAPDRYVVRVNENASVQEQNLRVDVRMHLSLPASYRDDLSKPSGNNNVLVPLLTLRKDTVADGLDFLPVGGKPVDSWQQRETKGLLAHTVQEFFYAAYTNGSTPSPTGLPPLDDTRERALAMVLELVGSTGAYPDDELRAVATALWLLRVARAPGAAEAATAL